MSHIYPDPIAGPNSNMARVFPYQPTNDKDQCQQWHIDHNFVERMRGTPQQQKTSDDCWKEHLQLLEEHLSEVERNNKWLKARVNQLADALRRIAKPDFSQAWSAEATIALDALNRDPKL